MLKRTAGMEIAERRNIFPLLVNENVLFPARRFGIGVMMEEPMTGPQHHQQGTQCEDQGLWDVKHIFESIK